MDAADKKMLDREALRNMIQQWNANRLDLFELSEPNENLEFHGVMRFYFQDSGQKIATKCIRVASDATVSDVIETLIEKFRPDMRMLSLGSYSLWETHGPDDERKLEGSEKPLLVQLNWHADDREGRFLLKCSTNNETTMTLSNDKSDQNFKRKLSKREKKELKKKEKLSRLKSDANTEKPAEKLYTELPETSFTRSISNPEAVMRRRRQQKLERKLQQFRSKDGGPDTGGTLKIYGTSLCPDVPYKTLLVSIGDSAAMVTREMLEKYGLSRHDPAHYCIVQVDTTDNAEYILEDDECPLAILMTHPHHSSIMFHVRRRPAEGGQPRRRKKKPGTVGTGGGPNSGGVRPGSEPALLETAPDGTPLENARRFRVADVLEIGSGNGTGLQLYGPSIQSRHCVISSSDGGPPYTVMPLHADAMVHVDGRRATRPTPLQHGSVLKIGRMSTFRFVDPIQESLLNRNLSQSQHFGSGSIYDRSPTSQNEHTSGAMSPTSMTSHSQDPLDTTNANTTNDTEYPRTMSPMSAHEAYYRDPNDMPYNNNTLKLDNESIMLSQHLVESKDEYNRDENSGSVFEQDHSAVGNRTANSQQFKDNYETTFDVDGNVETKSICSAKSTGSGHDSRVSCGVAGARPGSEAILPAVLEFPEAGQAALLAAVINRLDPHAPAFKLAPVYTLYLCARYRASTHYRPELTPTERAHKLTAFLHHVATLIHATVQERSTDSAAQAFWMANASELLHFLKCDRHISAFSLQAQELLPNTVQTAFSNLVQCFQEELSGAFASLCSASGEALAATAPVLGSLAAAMVLLRRCRANAALTIQLFTHLFHFINAVTFNRLIATAQTTANIASLGSVLSARLAHLAAWAERQGLELAADCHLATTQQAARLIQGEYRTPEEVRAALVSCYKLNSVQVGALLAGRATPPVLQAAVLHARHHADELHRADNRQITAEENLWLGVGLLIPGDGFSAEVVRGVPPGLAEFIAPLQRGGLCRLALQAHARGDWSVYMSGTPQPRPSATPLVQILHLNKTQAGMGLSIVAAKGVGQSKLGIYIKSVVPGGAAAADGRLAAGDQLLSVDGHSLQGITQERAAEYLVRTGPTVTLEVAKQGAVLHGLATLLHQPVYNQKQEEEIQYEDRMRRNSGTFTNPAFMRPTSPLNELATAGYSNRRPCQDRCHLIRDESTESSTDESEESHAHDHHPHYHGSIPRLIITLDRENNQIQEDMSPDTPGCPLELRSHPAPPRPIPVFTFTCEDFDEVNALNETPRCEPPPVPEPPANYEQISDCCEPIRIPPQMKPIDPRLTLDLFKSQSDEYYRRRCTGIDECISACDCCRTPQPDTVTIPFIDEPNSEPLIFENTVAKDKVATPKIRRILPSLSLDISDDKKPETADATCQTPSTPVEEEHKVMPTPAPRSLDLKLNLNGDSSKFNDIHCRLKRTLFSTSKSLSNRSEDTEIPSTYSTTESFDERDKRLCKSTPQTPGDGAKKVLDCVDRKSWKSPDEYRPDSGKVKALTKHFNDINLIYCIKNYKRNCQSSPNLSIKPVDKIFKLSDNLPSSASLADIQYESLKTDTSGTKGAKMSDDEVKSIIIQLEDWSKFGSRGSGDTLAQGNEFEIPNLPSEEHTENASTHSYVFNEIVDKKPRIITLENIKIKSSSVNSEIVKSEDVKDTTETKIPRVVAMIPQIYSLSALDVTKRRNVINVAKSCPNINYTTITMRNGYEDKPRSTGALRRMSERDLPSRLAAEPVKPSKSTPALHHAAINQNNTSSGVTSPVTAATAGNAAWAQKSRSTHNLATSPQTDNFYQNLPTLHQHQQQERWSSLRNSTASNRPQSAHYGPEPVQETPTLSQINQPNPMSVRNAKLAEMSEEVTRRQQQQQQQQMMQQYPPKPNSITPMSPTQHLMNQMNQPMHVHTMPQSPQLSRFPQQPSPQLSQYSQQMPQQSPQLSQYPQQIAQQSPQLSQYPQQMPQQSPQLSQYPQQMTQPSPQLTQMHIHTSQQQLYHNQHQQQQRFDWQPPGPPSPQKAQPPVAPKPQNMRRPDAEEEQLGPLQLQNSSQPDDDRFGASPWQREEREKQAEARRRQARGRRDATIGQLLSLGQSRTPAQNQQLRSLQLERDFEKRANQSEQEEPSSPEESPMAVEANDPRPPPKSILKMNRPDQLMRPDQTSKSDQAPRPEQVNGHHSHQNNSQEDITSIANNLSTLSVTSPPPPPPERGSSFAVMAELSSGNPQEKPNTNPPQSPSGRDKRVSFGGRAPPPPATSPPPLHAPSPDQFLEQASSVLESPSSPTARSPPDMNHTPGVIGAQEVYRDPRTKRLAEQAMRGSATSSVVPEQLSFRDKMRMFALEAGDPATPKDKVKISRAQRDIDAVH